jgi:hypothetical protein
LKNVQIFKIVRIVRKKKNEKIKENKKPEENNKIKKNEKRKNHTKNHPAALTGRPSVAPTRAERCSAPLTGGA